MGIYQVIQQLESLRKKRRACMAIPIVFFVGMMIIPMLFAPVAGDGGLGAAMPQLVTIGMIVGLIFATSVNSRLTKQYKALYKETFVRGVLSEIFQNVDYRYDMGFTQEQVRSFGLNQLGNRFYTEDYLRGTFMGVPFEQADVKIQYHTQSGKSSHTTTYFEGRMFILPFPVKKVFSVQIFSSNFRYRQNNPGGFKLQKVDLESEAFNKAFDVKAVQPHDAFYVLTPQMMEKITGLCNYYGNIALHFCGDYLFVAINSNMNAFDGDIRRPIDYQAERQQAMRDTQVIRDLIMVLQAQQKMENATGR